MVHKLVGHFPERKTDKELCTLSREHRKCPHKTEQKDKNVSQTTLKLRGHRTPAVTHRPQNSRTSPLTQWAGHSSHQHLCE